MTRSLRCQLIAICLLGLTKTLSAAEPVANWLGQTIVGPTQTVAELRAFAERRVPSMPEVKTVREWHRTAEGLRRDMLDRIVFRGKAARWRHAKTRVEWLDTIEGGPGYRIRKLRYEGLPGLWIPALLYEPETLSGKVPVVFNPNGHEPVGKAAPYKQLRCINLAKRGMLALNPEWIGFGQLNGPEYRHAFMNQLDLCGASGLAPFYLAMSRGLDVLLSLEHADRERVAVTGLSGGGWQTIWLSALDRRVTVADPVAGFSSLITRANNVSDLGDSEQQPCDMALVGDYTHLTALRAPRPTLLTYNATDNCCFASDHALPPLLQAAQPIFTLLGHETNLRYHINFDPGTHNYDRDNREAFYRLLRDFFFASDQNFSTADIPSEAEVKTAEQLRVELPANNATFHTLALALSREKLNQPKIPTSTRALKKWQVVQRKKLRELVRAADYPVVANRISSEESSGLKANFWQLKLTPWDTTAIPPSGKNGNYPTGRGNEWTVPVLDLSRGQPVGTTILVADDGKKSVATEVETLLAAGQRVLAVDLYYFGELKIARFDVRWALLIDTVGGRPLGVQAGQLNAVAGWAKSQHANEPVKVLAIGPRNSLISLVAAGLQPHGIDCLELRGGLDSLKEIIQKNWSADQKPEMFCFGLLDAFDISQLEALVTPRPIAMN